MAAAIELFDEQGYEATTVAEIAERAGLTKRTFFRYFSDKREVLFSGSQELQRRWLEGLAAAPQDASPLAVVTAGLDHDAAILIIDLQDALHAPHADQDTVFARQRPARQRSAGAARHDGHALGLRKLQDLADLLAIGWQHADQRSLVIGAQRIVLHLDQQSLALQTDGLGPFAVQGDVVTNQQQQ